MALRKMRCEVPSARTLHSDKDSFVDRKFSLGEEDDESAHATGMSQPTQARSRNSAA
jgi:hypothetical protein